MYVYMYVCMYVCMYIYIYIYVIVYCGISIIFLSGAGEQFLPPDCRANARAKGVCCSQTKSAPAKPVLSPTGT